MLLQWRKRWLLIFYDNKNFPFESGRCGWIMPVSVEHFTAMTIVIIILTVELCYNISTKSLCMVGKIKTCYRTGGGLGFYGLWYLMPLSTIFQLYHGGQFYWWRKAEYLEKLLTCRKWLTNFITVHLAWAGIEHTSLVMIDIGCIGSCKSNYHAITTTMGPCYRTGNFGTIKSIHLKI